MEIRIELPENVFFKKTITNIPKEFIKSVYLFDQNNTQISCIFYDIYEEACILNNLDKTDDENYHIIPIHCLNKGFKSKNKCFLLFKLNQNILLNSLNVRYTVTHEPLSENLALINMQCNGYGDDNILYFTYPVRHILINFGNNVYEDYDIILNYNNQQVILKPMIKNNNFYIYSLNNLDFSKCDVVTVNKIFYSAHAFVLNYYLNNEKLLWEH